MKIFCTHGLSGGSRRSCGSIQARRSRRSDWPGHLPHNGAVPKSDHLCCRARGSGRSGGALSPLLSFVAGVTEARTTLRRRGGVAVGPVQHRLSASVYILCVLLFH